MSRLSDRLGVLPSFGLMFDLFADCFAPVSESYHFADFLVSASELDFLVVSHTSAIELDFLADFPALEPVFYILAAEYRRRSERL